MSRDRRLSDKLQAYWLELRGDGVLPAKANIDKAELADVWDDCFAVNIINSDRRLPVHEYDYVGSNVADMLAGGVSSPAALSMFDQLSLHYIDLVGKRQPVTREQILVNAGGEEVKYRLCLLPFYSADAHVTDYVLGGVRYIAGQG